MEKFTFTYPTKVYFGEGAAAEALKQELPKVGKTVMLAYGGGSLKKSGVYDELKKLLAEAGKEVVDFSGIMPNPTYAKVQEGAKLVKERHVDFILAAGGGSVIDCCKVISAQAMTEEDIWDMEYQSGSFPAAGVPMGAVVTASGTGAEMNAGAVITYEEKLWKGPIFGTAAAFAILDPAYTATVPPMQVLSGAFDTLSHAMETYDCNHGQGLAVIHPAYYRHILKDAEEKFTRFAKEVFGKDTAEEGLEALTAFIEGCGLPTKLGQLKSKVEITPEVLRKVADTCNIIKCGPRELSRDEIYDILLECR